MIKQKNIPKLRFPDFEGEWEKKKLGEVANNNIKWSFTGGPFGSDLKSSDYTEIGIRVIQLQNIGDGIFINENKIYTSEEKANKLISCNIYPNEIIISKMGDPVARACIIPNFEKRYLMCSDGIRLLTDKNCYDNYFVFISINNESFRNEALSKSTGSTRKRIGLSELKEIKIIFPSLIEQHKIATFFRAIDAKLQSLKKKIDLLEQYKKGVMKKIFSQKLRFKDEMGKDYPKWEVKRLTEVSIKYSSNISANKIEDNFGEYIIYGASGILKKVDFYMEENDYISIIKDGAGVGRIFYCAGKSSVLGTMEIIKPKIGISTYFLYCLLSNIDFTKYITGSTIPHIYFKDYSIEECGIPCIEEQTKIDNFLSFLDKKIKYTQTQIEKAEQWKKGLLQKMFC